MYENSPRSINIMLDDGAYPPTRGHKADAGYDLRTRERVTVSVGNPAVIDTGVHFEIPEGFVGFLKSKSGLNVKNGINGEGVIDAGYTGSIVVKLYQNEGAAPVTFEPGDKIIGETCSGIREYQDGFPGEGGKVLPQPGEDAVHFAVHLFLQKSRSRGASKDAVESFHAALPTIRIGKVHFFRLHPLMGKNGQVHQFVMHEYALQLSAGAASHFLIVFHDTLALKIGALK